MGLEDDRVNEILYKYQELVNVQYNWLPQWQEKADYVCPSKNSIAVGRIPGYKRTQKVFDSTAIRAMNLFAAAMHGTLTPSFTKWFRLEFDDPEMNKVQENRNWWDLVNERIRININNSNFRSDGHELYVDLSAFGTACLYEDESKDKGWWGGLQFQSIPVGKFALSEGSDGKVDTLYRSYFMSAHAIKAQWPDDYPTDMEVKDHPDRLYEIIHAVYPTDYKDKVARKWRSVYLVYHFRHLLSDKNYYEFPYMVPRWQTYSDETYGSCLTDTALPDIRTLNKLVEMELRNLAKNVDPPLGNVQGEVIGPARMIPGGMTTVRSRDALFPIDTSGKYDVVNLKKEELRESINSVYMIDQLQLQTGPQMTATEVNVRYETMQRILGPHLGRLDNEWIKPLLSRTFQLMMRAGLFYPLPPALIGKLHGQPIGVKVNYEGPLARSQRSSDLTAIQSFTQTVGEMAKLKQDIIEVINFDELIRDAADILGLPSRAIYDEEQVEQIRQASQQVMEQQKEQEQMGQGADAAHALAPLARTAHQKPQDGSIMQKIMDSATGGGGQ